MYFPILTEIPFVKAFLKQGMGVAPAMAILLGGPGVSLPGAILIARFFGWKKMLVYEALEIGDGHFGGIFFRALVRRLQVSVPDGGGTPCQLGMGDCRFCHHRHRLDRHLVNRLAPTAAKSALSMRRQRMERIMELNRTATALG